jgi:hypothetical protein
VDSRRRRVNKAFTSTEGKPLQAGNSVADR